MHTTSRAVPSSRRPLLIAAVVVVAVLIAWYAFRPERLFITRTVNEAPPTAAAAPTASKPVHAAPVPLAQGRFHGNAHPTSGTATILDLGGGRRVLRLASFATSDGPDVHVVLVAASDVTDDVMVKGAGYVELGGLKGNTGDQNYDVPASVDLAKYRTATIWCRRFNVNFGSAPLTAAPPV